MEITMYIRKSISILMIMAILALTPFSTVNAALNIINQTSTTENITSGATLQKIVRFTDDGWLNINVLRVDLSNQYIKVGTMSNSDSIKTLNTVKSLAEANGAVAATNGGFFNWMKDAGSGYPDGPIVESGNIVTASSEYNKYGDSMATFSINNLNQMMYDYWKTDITLNGAKGTPIEVGQYNKLSRDFTDFTILDKYWGSSSMGVSADYPDITEMVVIDGKVSEIRTSQVPIPMPKNGYVVVTRAAGSQIIKANFKVGDAVGMKITTNPDWNKLKIAVTGSAILLKDGQIPSPYSFTIAGRQPRTIVGSSKDGSQLMLVTVDGRQNSSIGMTQEEASQLMLELGAYNALNLDGGGSTTMVARSDSGGLEVKNNPSDGSSRGIATAVGIFSLAPVSALDKVIIDTADTNIFVNTSRSFTVQGVDRYLNPVDVNPSDIKWSVSGIDGHFTGNNFYPTSVGDGKITASIGNLAVETDISVLSSPAQLTISDKSINMTQNSSHSFTVTGKNKNGYHAYINPADVAWSAFGSIGSFSQNTFTASGQGLGYIDAAVGNTHAYCAVSVASSNTALKDGFEANNGSFLAYPATSSGGYAISIEKKHTGNSSGKLSYDFTNLEGTRAAYMVFSNSGLKLDSNTTKLGLWVYNTHVNSNWLRAEVYDTSGNKHLLDLSKGINWTGWQYVEASLQGITAPSLLTRLYLVQTSPVSDSGSIYMDDLSIVASSYPSIDMSQVPQDTVPVDSSNKAVTYKKGPNSLRFSVFGQDFEPANILEKLFTLRLTDKINNYLNAAGIVGSNTHAFTSNLKVPFVSTNTGYKSFDLNGSRFIQLDDSNQGLRNTDSNEWHWFLQQLDSASGNNVFIFMANSPLSFSDNLESSLFQDVLTQYRKKTNKNVWVFFKGDENTSYMERGIKFVSTAGSGSTALLPVNSDMAKYVLVTVMGDQITFEFKPIV
jgi:exopolysaccharide biosynthesis protein